MNNDLLNIISAGGAGGTGGNDGGGVDDILRSRPRSLEEDNRDGGAANNYFAGGLHLGRSQSAAPETWEYRKIPSSANSSARAKPSFNGSDDTFFGRSRFFDEEEEDREAMARDAAGMVRRPASTGVIGRPNAGGGNDGDVNSILETLGLTSLESSVSDSGGGGGQQNANNAIPSYASTAGKPLGGIDGAGSLVLGAHSPNKKSIMEKIHERGATDKVGNYFGSQGESNNVFSNQGSQVGSGLQGNINNASSTMVSGAQQYQLEQQSSLSGQAGATIMGQQLYANQYVQQTQTTQHRQIYQQDQSLYQQPQQQQQQIYYQQQQQTTSAAPQSNYQDYRAAQQQANLNIMQNAISQQQTIYHIGAPAPQYGFEYHTASQQQHIQHGVPANHILLPHQQVATSAAMHGQPQYISIVPIQTGPHVIGGAPGHAYAYVQYGGDGVATLNAQPTLVTAAGGAAPATTFVMGPSGPIAVQAAPVSIGTAVGYAATTTHGSSPPGGGGGRSPTRRDGNGGSGRTPDRDLRGRKKNPLTSPRGGGGKSRADKNSVPSKLGPEAAGLLNEIRAAKSRNQWTIHDIQGHVVEFCLDQNGSRFIQQRLEVADAIEKNAVMDEIVPAIRDLQNDVFGNYVVQKLYEFGTEGMKRDLRGTLEGNMLLLSLQMYGCRVVQKALESLDYNDLCELLQEFDSYVLTCIQDQNGNHVMQKCIEVMSVKAKEAEARTSEVGLSVTMARRIQFVVDDVLANVRTLCCHPYGCRVLQRMLEHCVECQKTATLDKIQLCHKALLDDQYGNYVIQHVLQYGRESDRDSLLKIIVENDLLKLSRQKFASNVVEKLLKYGNSNQRNAIVREMLKIVSEGGTSQEGVGSSVLLLMVRDAYANYVVQTAIDVVPEGNEKRMLLEELKANEVQLRNYTFAKHIVAKLGAK